MAFSSSDADLRRRAQGSDVLPPEEVRRLQELARRRENKRLQFFNSRDGWLLRNVVRDHRVLHAPKKYCALCGINTSRTALRSKPNSSCNQCFVNLCTVPRKDEAGLSCWQEWHSKDKLVPRVYHSRPAKRRHAERTEAKTSSDSECPGPSVPGSPPVRRSPRFRRHVSESPPSSASEQRRRSRRRFDSPGVKRFREQRDATERHQRARESVQSEARDLVHNWSRHRTLEGMIGSLSMVLPPNAPRPSMPSNIFSAYRRARASVHRDSIMRLNPPPTTLQIEVAHLAFIALSEKYELEYGV